MSKLDYKQPSFYHFSQDSVVLAKYIAEISQGKKELRLLDLGCGCGVIGIEFCLNFSDVSNLIFVEKQKEFLPYLEENLKLFIPNFSYTILNKSFSDVAISEDIDIVVSNPPYYLENSGRLPPNQQKQICHFIDQKEWDAFWKRLQEFRQQGAECYFTGRNDQKYLQDLEQAGSIIKIKDLTKSAIFKIA